MFYYCNDKIDIETNSFIKLTLKHEQIIISICVRHKGKVIFKNRQREYIGEGGGVFYAMFFEGNHQFVQLNISSLLLLSGEVSHKPPPSRTQNLMRRISSTRESGELTPKKPDSNHDLYTLNCFIHTKLTQRKLIVKPVIFI